MRTEKDLALREKGRLLWDMVGSMRNEDLLADIKRISKAIQENENKAAVQRDALEIIWQELECRGFKRLQ